jgi:putative glutamine amidotransferase
MKPLPFVLVTPAIAAQGSEFRDLSISLSEAYQAALIRAGAIPVILPATESREVIAACVARSDGVLMTGGEDVDPRIYAAGMPPRLRRLAKLTPDGGRRDLRELLLIDETLRQRRPLLAICRGHQLLNVALGGTLTPDLQSCKPHGLNHLRMDRRDEIVHDVQLTEGSLLANITGKATLGVNSTHHQAIARVAPAMKATAVSRDGIVEGVELKPGAAGVLPFLLGVQFHPERLAERHEEHHAVFCAFARACTLNGDKKL